MLFPVRRLLEGRGTPLSVSGDIPTRQALELMIRNDFSQLPVVDRSGRLTGMVSEQSISRTLYHLEEAFPLDLTVDHFQTRAITLPPESDLFEALDRLQNNYAVVVAEDQMPIGILTDYDTTRFFRSISEGLLLVEDIEVTLRQYIEAVFPEEHSLLAALMSAFSPDRRDPSKPGREYDQLNFSEHIRLITDERNWPKFEGAFEPKDLFRRMMRQVGDIRNPLAHFRTRLDPTQRDALIRAREWMERRPRTLLPGVTEAHAVEVHAEDIPPTHMGGKYEALQQWLVKQSAYENNIRLTFKQIQEIIGSTLPSSAREHRSWWSNDPVNHTQSQAWLQAGWRVEDVDMGAETLTLNLTSTAHTQLFFTDLLEQLRAKRRDLAASRRIQPTSILAFSSGYGGFTFQSAFRRDGLRVELYIDLEDYDKNKSAFDKLAVQKDAIEREINGPLIWERIDKRRASRIYAVHTGTISESPDDLAEMKQWALIMFLKFADAFQPRIRDL